MFLPVHRGSGSAVGDGGIVIATKAHLDGLGARLKCAGFRHGHGDQPGTLHSRERGGDSGHGIMANGQWTRRVFNEMSATS